MRRVLAGGGAGGNKLLRVSELKKESKPRQKCAWVTSFIVSVLDPRRKCAWVTVLYVRIVSTTESVKRTHGNFTYRRSTWFVLWQQKVLVQYCTVRRLRQAQSEPSVRSLDMEFCNFVVYITYYTRLSKKVFGVARARVPYPRHTLLLHILQYCVIQIESSTSPGWTPACVTFLTLIQYSM